tara:strand:- start:218 stop:634 length:417 start_codon:yes stop_codon:yes gene_type:complete
MMNRQIVIVFLCYSLNPFIRKTAINQLNDYTGYALIQTTTLAGNVFYLLQQRQMLRLDDVYLRNIQYSLGSSALTVLSSYHMTKLLKENATSTITTQIQVLTIVTSFFVDYLFNRAIFTQKQIFGVLMMIGGIALSSK